MRKILTIILLVCNVLAVLPALITAYVGYIDPTHHARLSTVSILFPYTVLPVVAFLVVWLFVRRRYMLISLLTLVAILPALRTTFPVNFKSTPPSDAIKVLTYNVWLFDKWDFPQTEDNAVVRYICNSGADIVCLQEACFQDYDSIALMRPLAEVYPYRHVQCEGDTELEMALLSKFPILHAEQIPYSSTSNLSMAYELAMGDDTLLVVNNHFETNAITSSDRLQMNAITHSTRQKTITKGRNALHLHRKLAHAARKRAPQARAVAQYIKDKGKKYVIVCGDFNDHPLSYTYRTVAKNLTDCYVATGNGRGYSYWHSNIHVRIDHMLCSKAFKPYAFKVDSSMDLSDHYPLYGYLQHKE